MNSILEDEIKILTLGPSSEMDNTSKIESRLQHRLLQLHKDNLLPTSLYDLIPPTGSQRPRLYGLPETRKKVCNSNHPVNDRFRASPAGQNIFFFKSVLTLY